MFLTSFSQLNPRLVIYVLLFVFSCKLITCIKCLKLQIQILPKQTAKSSLNHFQCAIIVKIRYLSFLYSLAGVNLTDESCETLASILQSGNSHLVELDLSFNSLGDLGVKLLCASLSNPHNKLEKLTLSHNELEHIGVKLLCDCLMSPHCKLHTLGFVFILLMLAIMMT